jgi:hypothetical protein
VREDAIVLLGTWLEKLKLNIENEGGSVLRRLRLSLGCNIIAAAAFITVSCLMSCILFVKVIFML